ncbi:hypothetical protein Tco_1030048, partial [Tanacetum coccineum]
LVKAISLLMAVEGRIFKSVFILSKTAYQFLKNQYRVFAIKPQYGIFSLLNTAYYSIWPVSVFIVGLLQEMVDRDMTMEEYDQYETEQALGNGKVFHWETATYSKIRCVEDINDRKFFETKFPAIVYDDALSFKSSFSSKPTLSEAKHLGMDIKEMDKNKGKADKTEHKNEKSARLRV